MSNTSTIQLSISVTGDGLSCNYAPTSQNPVVNPNAPGAVPEAILFSAGNTTLAIPAGTQSVVFYPAVVRPGPNSNAKTVGGLGIHPALPFYWSPAPGTTSVVVHVTADETMLVAFC